MTNHNKGWHHSKETKRKLCEAQLGEKSKCWKGGTLIDSHGYRRVTMSPDSPYFSMAHRCTSRKRMRDITEHRLVMAEHLGRCLYPFEIVHHINGIRGDNHPRNLAVVKEHSHSSWTFIKELQRHIRDLEGELSQHLLTP